MRDLPDLHLPFSAYVYLAVFANLLGALASFATGISDRYGRANIITAGLLVSGLLCLAGFPLCHSRTAFTAVYLLLGLVEGIILVATPALVRDFSPQVGRASAMASGAWARSWAACWSAAPASPPPGTTSTCSAAASAWPSSSWPCSHCASSLLHCATSSWSAETTAR